MARSVLYIIRHCQSLGQSPESDLSNVGIEQAEKLSNYISSRGISRIITSPFKRAIESAKPLAMKLAIEIEIKNQLAERSLGNTKSEDWRAALLHTFQDPSFRYNEGESTNDAISRIEAFLASLLPTLNSPTAVFTHGNIISLMARIPSGDEAFNFWRSIRTPDIFEYQDTPTHSLKRVSW